jgi:NADH/NAD ratio-sensing transcriptional regulator Rex
MTTVAINPIPKANATNRRRFFSIIMFLEYSVVEDISSEVISRMIAVTASQRLMSDIDIGKLIS